jgi:hypothetical protein
MAEKWKPGEGEMYYTTSYYYNNKYNCFLWRNYKQDIVALESNACFKTKEEAIAATNLCLSALRGELVRREDVIKALKKLSEIYIDDYTGSLESGIYLAIKAVEKL